MATEVIKTIKSSGGDYTSLAAWEAAQQGDLTGVRDEIAIAECYDFADPTNVPLDGWVTSATQYIKIYSPLAERHDGGSRDVSGSGYQLSSASAAGTIEIRANHIYLEGLNIKNTGTNPALAIPAPPGVDNLLDIKDCIFQNSASSSTNYVCGISRSGAIVNIQNTIMYGGSRVIDTRDCTSVTLNYVTMFCHTNQLVVVGDSELTTKNCYAGKVSGALQDFWTGGVSPSGSNNASSDSTSQIDYTDSIINQAPGTQFTNIISGSEDFTLKSGSGLEASGVAIGGITTDIIGTTRDGSTPDIGAFERISVVTSAPSTLSLLGVGHG